MVTWVTVVDWAPLSEADAQFQVWLRDHRLNRDEIPTDMVKSDTGRGEDYDRRRYQLAEEFLRSQEDG